MSNPDCFSEKVGKFQLTLLGEMNNDGELPSPPRFKVSVKPDGEKEIEILSCDDYCKASRLFVMIYEKGDWRDYKKYLDFLDLK